MVYLLGFEYEEHLNYLIDISKPTDEVFQGIGRRTRKNIRRGRNREIVIVEQVTMNYLLSASIHLLQKTYQNARGTLAHSSLFVNVF